MTTRRKKPRLAVTVDAAVAARVNAAARDQRVPISRIVNDVLRQAISMGALGEHFTLPRWDGRHLQVVLDLSRSVAEVKDLVYTVLNRGWPLDWDSPIDFNAPYLRELAQAAEARLATLRGAPHPEAGRKGGK
jgi:hypothetical protein